MTARAKYQLEMLENERDIYEQRYHYGYTSRP